MFLFFILRTCLFLFYFVREFVRCFFLVFDVICTSTSVRVFSIVNGCELVSHSQHIGPIPQSLLGCFLFLCPPCGLCDILDVFFNLLISAVYEQRFRGQYLNNDSERFDICVSPALNPDLSSYAPCLSIFTLTHLCTDILPSTVRLFNTSMSVF
jgi:hypothetical protein